MFLSTALPSWLLISSAGAFATQRYSTSSNCQHACGVLADNFGSQNVHYYGQDNLTLWDAKQNDVQYACRFEPSTKTDVAAALRVLTKTRCNFAVKCGGHSRDPDFSNSVGGVTIDLRRMNSVELATNGSSAKVGGGAVTAEIYAALDRHNISFVGGRVGSVGLGGFATGGGTSPLSSRHGWALDNIYEFELLLPNATFVTVNESQHPELYWALRGAGGGNFGIVTSFVVRTFPQGRLYSDRRTWSDNYTTEVVDRMYDLFTAEDNNADVSADFYYGYNQTANTFAPSGSLRYYEPVEEPPVFAPIGQIPSVVSAGQVRNLSSIAGSSSVSATPPPQRHLFQTLTTYPSRAWLQQSLAIFREESRQVQSVEGFFPQIVTYAIPSRALRGMADRGGNALGLEGVKGPLLITFLSTGWLRAEDDGLVGDFYDRVLSRLGQTSKDLNTYHPFKYIGYGRFGEDIFATYGAENRAKLERVQESVDPEGIFTSTGLCPGGFKIR